MIGQILRWTVVAAVLGLGQPLLRAQGDLPTPGNAVARAGGGLGASSNPGYDGQPIDPSRPIAIELIAPRPGSVIDSDTVEVRLDVRNYQLAPGGNRVHVVLDNRPSKQIYGPGETAVFEGLAPGGHLLRIFAVKGNGEMHKSKSAAFLEHFYVFQKTQGLIPSGDEAILTVSSPRGLTYSGADAQAVVFDYVVSQVELSRTGNRVEFKLGWKTSHLHKPGPIFLPDLPTGDHRLEARVVDARGEPLPGRFNEVIVPFKVQR